MQLSQLLGVARLDVNPVVAGRRDVTVRGVYTTDLANPDRYLDGGELVLTSGTWYRRPEDSEIFVGALARAGSAALIVGTAELGTLPPSLAEACERHGLALFTIGDETSFAAVTEFVMGALAGPGRRTPSAELHRELLASLASGAGPSGLMDVLARSTGIWSVLLSASGRRIEGHIDGVTEQDLARIHRKALTGGRPHDDTTSPGGAKLSIHPVQSPVAQRPPAAYLVCEGDHQVWAPGVGDGVAEVCALLALARAARRERARIEQRLLREALQSIRDDSTDAAEDRLRSLDLQAGVPFICVLASTHSTGYGGELAAAILEDVAEQVPGCSVVIVEQGSYVMLIPATGEDEQSAVARLTETAQRLRPLLGAGHVSIGIGRPGRGAPGLRSSLRGAEHAHRAAGQKSGTIRTAGDEDLSSQLLLLASVPDEVRALFRERVLGRLESYDAARQSELVHTLGAFLGTSGSYSVAAQQLGVHVNTLRYRLGRIETITGRRVTNLADQVDFHLALTIRGSAAMVTDY